jgi:hypothetical protein
MLISTMKTTSIEITIIAPRIFQTPEPYAYVIDKSPTKICKDA